MGVAVENISLQSKIFHLFKIGSNLSFLRDIDQKP